MTVTPLEAWQLAAWPALTGYMFEGMALVNDLVPYARKRRSPALDAALEAQAAALKARQAETAQLVVDLEALQKRLGLDVRPRPSTPAEFRSWLEAVLSEGRALAANPAHEAGEIFGGALTALGTALLVHSFLAVASPQPLLRARLVGLSALFARLRDRSAAVAGAVPSKARPAAERLRDLLAAAPIVDSDAHSARVTELQQSIAAIYDLRGGLEDGLR